MPNKITLPREPLNAFTHMAGIILSAIGTIYIIIMWLLSPDINIVNGLSGVAFGLSLIALYSSSTVYHWSHGDTKRIKMLRKLDHAMIYVLIAGSYSPILLAFLPMPKAAIFTVAMWGVAFVGIIIKLFFFGAPRVLSTALYILMGWAIVVDLSAVRGLGQEGFALLLTGGIFYTIGGLIYAIKRPNFSKHFGFHELFHFFVLLGSISHYFVVVIFVL